MSSIEGKQSLTNPLLVSGSTALWETVIAGHDVVLMGAVLHTVGWVHPCNLPHRHPGLPTHQDTASPPYSDAQPCEVEKLVLLAS